MMRAEIARHGGGGGAHRQTQSSTTVLPSALQREGETKSETSAIQRDPTAVVNNRYYSLSRSSACQRLSLSRCFRTCVVRY